MKRVAVDTREAFNRRSGGIPRYLRNFIKSLTSLKIIDFDVILLIPSSCQKEISNFFSWRNNIEVVYLEERSAWHWEQVLVPKWCSNNRISLVHFSTNRGPILNQGVRDVHVIHDTISIHKANWENGFYHGLTSYLYNQVSMRLSAKTASHLITVSEFSRKSIIKELFVPPEKVSVIYNGVEPLFFSPPELELKNLSFSDKPFIFHLGSFDPRKNTERVIRAYSSLPSAFRSNCPLVIAGLSQKAKEKFIPLISSLRIEKEAILLPFITDEELAAIYKTCFAFIWPSLWEGFGLPVLEAMAAGAPVLTSNSTSLPESSGGCALLVDPMNTEEITKGIMRLIEDQSLREELKEKGKTWAKNFTWENTVRETINVWKKVLET